jgi:class 3 adenylate cyclase
VLYHIWYDEDVTATGVDVQGSGGGRLVSEPSSKLPRLADLDLFSGVPAALCEPAVMRHYADGEVILTSGTAADKLVVLMRGFAEIREDGVYIAMRPAVRLLGELALIDGQPRTASVIARGMVTTHEFAVADATALLDHPAFLANLARELAWKLRGATAERAIQYRQHQLLFGEFRAHVSAEVLQQLLAAGNLGAPRRSDVVALFADIRGFTTKTLTIAPDQLLAELGTFLDRAVDVIHAHGGMVDKFIGDCVMALWGYAPHPDDAARAVAAAEALVCAARGLTVGGEPLRIGVGVESGLAMLGVVGSAGKRQFTALGVPVNLAARLQEETKRIGIPIAIGPDLASRIPDGIRSRLGTPITTDIRGVGATSVWPLGVKE